MLLKKLYIIYAILTGRNLFIKFNKLLFQLSLRGLGIYNYQSMRLSGERLFIEKILYPLSLNKKKFLVFDVGANIGDYTKIILDS